MSSFDLDWHDIVLPRVPPRCVSANPEVRVAGDRALIGG